MKDHSHWDPAREARINSAATTWSTGPYSVRLDYANFFLPLRMVDMAIARDLQVKATCADSHMSCWSCVRIDSSEERAAPLPWRKNSGTGRQPQSEHVRTITLEGDAHQSHVGHVKFEAQCEVYRHEGDDYGWEPGKITVTYTWLFEPPATASFTFENFYDNGDTYVSRIKSA